MFIQEFCGFEIHLNGKYAETSIKTEIEMIWDSE